MKSRSGNQQVRYTPRPGTAPEQELDALTAVYRFILDRHVEKQTVDRVAQSQARKKADEQEPPGSAARTR